jgi:lipid-A-disaccharide synthase
MAAFYKVSPLSWWMGRHLVKVPFFSMVNLVAGGRVIPELIQNDATPAALAAEAVRLLEDAQARERMRSELAGVAAALGSETDPMERAADRVMALVSGPPERAMAPAAAPDE